MTTPNSFFEVNVAVFNRIRGWFNGLPEWIQEILKRAVYSVAVLIIFSQVATYWYALNHGARVPLEGVPFLIVISIIAGLVLSVISTITLLLIPLGRNFERENHEFKSEVEDVSLYQTYVRFLYKFLRIMAGSNPAANVDLKFFATLLTLVAGATAVVVTYKILPTYLETIGSLFEVPFTTVSPFAVTVMVISLYVFTFFLWAIRLGKVTVEAMEKASTLLYRAALLGLIIAMMSSPFSHVLRAARYGGGIEVDIVARGNERLEKVNLFLTSSDTVTVWNRSTNSFQQFNSSHIVSMKYKTEPGYKMPLRRGVRGILLGPN